jgi:hypothetical protein
MNTEKKLDRDAIMVSFDLLSDRLRQRDADVLEIIVVGGSFLALHGLRNSTTDVDSVTRIDETFQSDIDSSPDNWVWTITG